MGVCQSVLKAVAKANKKEQQQEEEERHNANQGGNGGTGAAPELGSAHRPFSYASAAGASGPNHPPATSSWNNGPPVAAAHAPSYAHTQQQPQPGSGSGLSRAIFFPDEAMPCRNYSSARGCRRSNCSYAHGRTSLMELLDEIGKARSTLDICVFTITCNEIASGR
jgi:hypothetical protein